MWCTSKREVWYAIFVLGGQEEKVRKKLQDKFENKLKFIVPKRLLRERKNGKWNQVERLLFPGYVFVRGNITVEDYYEMKGTFGMIKLLRGASEPLRIQDEEIFVISRLIGENSGEIGFSRILKKDDVVRVMEGPLIGLEGRIIKIDKRKGRAKVGLDFLGNQKIIELGVEMVV